MIDEIADSRVIGIAIAKGDQAGEFTGTPFLVGVGECRFEP